MATVSKTDTKNWLTKAQFADELGVKVNNLNQILANGPKQKKFSKANNTQKKPDPTDKTRVVFSPAYVALVKHSRKDLVPTKKPDASPVKAIKSPDLIGLSVPVSKKHLAVLDSLGITEDKLVTKLKGVVDELYKKAQGKLDEVKKSIAL